MDKLTVAGFLVMVVILALVVPVLWIAEDTLAALSVLAR